MPQVRLFRTVIHGLFLLSITGFFACSHKSVKPDESSFPAAMASEILPNSDSGNAFGLETIHFVYDSNLLTPEAKKTLKANAKILKSRPALRIQIEGHCDQRGGIQYNIALGEKRARSAKHFLEDLGIADGRIATVSYGKGRPIDPAESESAYAKNRRANFVITKSAE
jgi:peptidoglycan-associated lipoprotein